MKKITRTITGAALLAAFACGCSSGYPSTKERVENVDETIKGGNLPGTGNDMRDKRFEKEVTQSPAVGTTTPPK